MVCRQEPCIMQRRERIYCTLAIQDSFTLLMLDNDETRSADNSRRGSPNYWLACNMGEMERIRGMSRDAIHLTINHTATMSLERAMTRLSLRPASICRECRRTFTSPAKPRQQQSAVGAIAGMSTHISNCALRNK